jgi:putative transcriptional regulator
MYSLFDMGKTPAKLRIETSIHVCRAEKKLTQQQLADAVGVTRATIISIEKGNYNPSLALAFRIARYFEKDIKDIFFAEDINE